MELHTLRFRHRENILDRFWEKIKFNESNFCWEWIGAISKGYGMFGSGGASNSIRAHRFSYMLIKGHIPKNKQLDHLCRNKRCVNPEHLEIVTLKENIKRFNKSREYCKRGHILHGDNLRIDKNGSRVCIKCNKDRCNAFYYSKIH